MAAEQHTGGSRLRAGFARVVITPPLGVSLAGSYSDRRAEGLHDNLYARAFVLDAGAGGNGDQTGGQSAGGDGERDSSQAIAVVSCDLIGVRASTVAGARRLIEQACGIPGDHVLIAATHNHSGPLTRELVASGLAGETDEPYLAQLEHQIAAAVQDAFRRCAPARLRLTLGRESGIAFNRRFLMKEGPVRTNPGKQNPDVLRPAGPVDDRVWVLTALPAADDDLAEGAASVPPHGAPWGMLVNFGLHPAIVAGTIIGGDFPAYLELGVQRLLGCDGAATGRARTGDALAGRPPVVVFANAPCGDVNHLDVSHRQRQTGFAEAARVGTILAAEAVKAACRLVPDWELSSSPKSEVCSQTPTAVVGRRTSDQPTHLVRGARRPVPLPLRRPSADEVTWARRAIHGRMTMVPGAGLEVVEAHRILALAEGWTGETYTTEVQGLAIGDELAIVGLPGEVFAELGLALRERSPFHHTLVLGLANEAIGYVPTHRAFAEGGYEPASSRLQPGGGERLVDEAVALLRELRSG